MTLIRSPSQVEIDGPLIYLAGPISDTANWRADAVRYLTKIDPTIHVADPRGARPFRVDMAEQFEWERNHLRLAGTSGAILFWFPCPGPNADVSYAVRSLLNLGEWATRAQENRQLAPIVVVGIEAKFPGEVYLRRRLAEDFPRTLLCAGLRKACVAAVSLVRQRVTINDEARAAIGFFDEDDD